MSTRVSRSGIDQDRTANPCMNAALSSIELWPRSRFPASQLPKSLPQVDELAAVGRLNGAKQGLQTRLPASMSKCPSTKSRIAEADRARSCLSRPNGSASPGLCLHDSILLIAQFECLISSVQYSDYFWSYQRFASAQKPACIDGTS